MIYGSSQGQSALGSLLRKIQEESMTNPAKVPINASEASPIRQQVQGPLESPEAIGSEKVVAMKPELAPSTETPSPVAARTIPAVDGSAAGAVAAGATPVSPVVRPISIPTSPEIGQSIVPSISTKEVSGGTPSTSNKISLPSTTSNVGIGSKSPSLATSKLLPTVAKSYAPIVSPEKLTGTISQGSKGVSQEQKASLLSGGSAMARASSVLSRLMIGAGGLAGTLMSKTTLGKILENAKYGGKKVTKG